MLDETVLATTLTPLQQNGYDPLRIRDVADALGYHDNAFRALAEVGEVISAGWFWLPADRTFPLTEITEAHRTSEQGRVRGRLVLVIGPRIRCTDHRGWRQERIQHFIHHPAGRDPVVSAGRSRLA